MFTGDPVPAAEAVALGLANGVVPAADVLSEARRLAQRLVRHSPLVLSLLKKTLVEGAEMPLSSALAYEQAMIGLVLDSDDAHDGCSAFLERRPANFKGA